VNSSSEESLATTSIEFDKDEKELDPDQGCSDDGLTDKQ